MSEAMFEAMKHANNKNKELYKEIASLQEELRKVRSENDALKDKIQFLENANEDLQELVANVPTYINDITELKRQFDEANAAQSKVVMEQHARIAELERFNEDLKMVCRRLSATKKLEVRDQIADQCKHLFAGSILREEAP